MQEKLTLEEIAQRKSKNFRLSIEYTREIVKNQPEFFSKFSKSGKSQLVICRRCSDRYSIDGHYRYVGIMQCETCGIIKEAHEVRPFYNLEMG